MTREKMSGSAAACGSVAANKSLAYDGTRPAV
jgi:hypothetical protein